VFLIYKCLKKKDMCKFMAETKGEGVSYSLELKLPFGGTGESCTVEFLEGRGYEIVSLDRDRSNQYRAKLTTDRRLDEDTFLFMRGSRLVKEIRELSP
jgi:hypothetical protein